MIAKLFRNLKDDMEKNEKLKYDFSIFLSWISELNYIEIDLDIAYYCI